MTKKIYGMYGFIERYVTMKLGKGVATFHFKNGVLDASGVVPATFATNNAFEQSLIEGHPLFKSGAIKVVRSEVIEEPEKNDCIAVEEVTTLVGAKQYLTAQGVPAEELQTKAKVLEKAAEMNISFPNW